MSFTRFPHGVSSFGIPLFGNIPPLHPGDIHWVVSSKTTSSPMYTIISEQIEDGDIFSSMATAYDSTTTNHNDVVILAPETHTISSSLTWANYNTHLIGNHPGRVFQAHAARFEASADFTPVITNSGYYNTWANLRIAHGRGTAANYIGVEMSGHYNYWNNVDLWSPGNVAEGADAGMVSMNLSGGNNYFEGCTIGGDSRLRSAANKTLDIKTNGVQNVFKDCVFMMYTDDAEAKFIWVSSGAGVQNRWTLFDNCTFIAYSVNWGTSITVAVGYNYSGGNGHRLLFKDCSFMGVTDVISSDDSYRNNCWFSGGNTYLGATTGTGLYAVST